jgi:hypothetical protein
MATIGLWLMSGSLSLKKNRVGQINFHIGKCDIENEAQTDGESQAGLDPGPLPVLESEEQDKHAHKG